MWNERTDFDEPPAEDKLDLIDHEDDESEPVDTVAYRKLIFSSPAYGWLVATLRKEFYLLHSENDTMARIRADVVKHIPATQRISRKKPLETHKARFHANWNLVQYFTEQGYGVPIDEALPHALTLTAVSYDLSQCLPCLSYLSQTWPFTGRLFMKFLSSVLRNPSEVVSCKEIYLVSNQSLYSAGVHSS